MMMQPSMQEDSNCSVHQERARWDLPRLQGSGRLEERLCILRLQAKRIKEEEVLKKFKAMTRPHLSSIMVMNRGWINEVVSVVNGERKRSRSGFRF